MKEVVDSACVEFAYELLSALPYAYSLHLKDRLEKTISAYDTSCLYFFSPNHTEKECERSWNNMPVAWQLNIPNINIHKKELDWENFVPPPLKQHYQKNSIKFQKETLVIFNRYNYEWYEPPINFLDLKTLSTLFDLLQDEYQIIYINIKGHPKYYDKDTPALDLGDEELIKKYPKVLSINNILSEYPNLTYNEVQCKIFANCEKYISSNGGQLVLSAYFGGENIIFSKKSQEHKPEVNSWYRWYHKLGGGIFKHVKTEQELIKLVKEKWVDKKPLINILIRTSGRPNYFRNCINSIYEQTYSNWNIIVSVDDKDSEKYVQPEKCLMIKCDYSGLNNIVQEQWSKINRNNPTPLKYEEFGYFNKNYGQFFVYNLYLNDLQKQVQKGYCLILDDDVKFFSPYSLKKIVEQITNDDQLLIWKAKLFNQIVPSDENFYKPPVVKDIDSACFCFHNKYCLTWKPFKRGDFRICSALFKNIPEKIFIDDVLTGSQRKNEAGMGLRDDLPNNLNLSCA
jgi:hypothetical protein